ncbi:MAG: tRNA (cytidine(56)-2'-O)-methyltransferase [Nitrososphaerales archaeon]|nr:tRNA (cytidine(56)-2'-O)-methyltransferase [Nitrososphaerales archaeon]
MKIKLLRLGHRIHIDHRPTTHCAFVARAFGSSEMYYCGNEDDSLQSSIEKVNESWGGDFSISFVKSWKSFINKCKRENNFVILCTMYGKNIPDIESELRSILNNQDIVIIIGSEKIPPELINLSDINVAISNQPHSEVAALAILLDRLFQGKQLDLKFTNSKLNIIPQEKGKSIYKS